MTSAHLKHAIQRGEAIASAESFDAIVVGSGAAGGLAALRLCEGGLNVLLVDAAYPTPFWRRPFSSAHQAVTRFAANTPGALSLPRPLTRIAQRALRFVGQIRQPIQSQCYAWERMPEAFVDDRDFPYRTPELQPFSWIRTQTLGGRMVVPGHGWQYYRLPACDFQSADDDFSSWPITLEDLEPWYADVETLLGLSGSRDGLSCPPDGVIASVIHPDALEARMKDRIQARWPQANVILSRFASPAPCLDMAAATGRLTCRTGAVVTRILGARSGRADGVEWMDKRNADLHSARAPLVFLCASTIESARILMNSRTETDLAPGERSGCLGAFLTDRTIVRIEGTIRNTHHPYPPPPGRCLQLPRFDGRNGASGGRRGFGVQLYTYPSGNSSFFTAVAFIEGAPRASNRIRLRADPSGPEPSLEIDYSLSDVDHRLSREASKALRELADCLGAVTTHIDTAPSTPGLSIHECGTARMGADPSSSVLSPQNECWDMPGLFVTDGSAFPSQGSQNPALTIMALTARACRYALSQRAA